ncbi:hypothetical protein [Nocardia sp. NPDC058666]|uniref:hypothetical protein n=1 Tax=Nocardia sp. NPDC058666 TaxID=3346587 RepID=UPI00365B4F8C
MSRSKKYSVSLPEDLAEAVRDQVGSGGFSAYIAVALERQVAMDKLGEIVADYERDHEPLDKRDIDAARALLRGAANSADSAA